MTLFAPDRFFQVTIRTWTGAETHVVPDATTSADATQANAASVTATGWPVYVRPGDVAKLRSAARRRRWWRRG